MRGPGSTEYTYSPDFGFKITFTKRAPWRKMTPGLQKRKIKPGISFTKKYESTQRPTVIP